MKSIERGIVGRCALILITILTLQGCGASTTTERMNEKSGDEKLGKVDEHSSVSDGIDMIDSSRRSTTNTDPIGATATTRDTRWSFDSLSLDIYEKEIPDTSEHASFRFHVRNSSDSLAVIDRVEPSCGCIMATVQKSFAVKGKEGEIYVGLVVSRMSDIQPYTIDVYTTLNPDKPLRLTLRKVAVPGASGK